MVILGSLILLRHFNVSITPILTALGVGGLAVALALQDTLSNLFGGFYVAVAGQVRLGDYIKLNTGEEGYVTDIGWRCTTFRAPANNMIIVPNAKLAQAIVTNYNLPEKRMAANFVVTVGYDCDPGRGGAGAGGGAEAGGAGRFRACWRSRRRRWRSIPDLGRRVWGSRRTSRWPNSRARARCVTS